MMKLPRKDVPKMNLPYDEFTAGRIYQGRTYLR